MGYIASRSVTTNSRNLELLEISVTGAPSVNSYFTLTAGGSTFSSSISGSGGTSITLPTGSYKAATYFAVNKVNTGQRNYQYQLELDGSLIGFKGQTKSYNNENIDSADAVFNIETGTQDLRLKLLAIEYSAPVHYGSESKIWLWRSIL